MSDIISHERAKAHARRVQIDDHHGKQGAVEVSVVLGINVAEGAFAEPKEGDPEQHGGQEGLKADGVAHGRGHLCLGCGAFIYLLMFQTQCIIFFHI